MTKKIKICQIMIFGYGNNESFSTITLLHLPLICFISFSSLYKFVRLRLRISKPAGWLFSTHLLFFATQYFWPKIPP